MNTLPNRRVLLAGFASVMTTAACGLPRSGPKTGEIMAGTTVIQNPSFVVPVTQPIARAATLNETFAFPSAFLRAGLVGSDTIYAGDKLTVSVWENVDDGVMGRRGTPTMLQDTQVDGDGYIYIPYAGRVRASGMSPDALRNDLTDRLAEQTPNPQVQVARVAGDGASVSVMGDVASQGVYAIERPTRNLSSMIARAGGVSIKPDVTQVTVTRGSQSGSIWLKDLYENPKLDIALRGGDIILVAQDSRSFTALGSTAGQARVPFPSPVISALEGIAVVGGLQTMLADPKGIFIFREETPQITNAVLARTDITTPQNVVYLLNLTEPNGMFTARDFMMRDGDTMYVTEAPYTQWTKVLSVLTGSATSANSLASIASGT